ncbi:MAG: hypothetical protein ACXWPM_13035 [Bdellovibrionota bacterium]
MLTKLLDSKLLKTLWIFGPIATIAACGLIGLGGGTGNDVAPTGTIVAQGPFQSSLAGKTVSGTALVYNVTATGQFVIRLQSMSITADSGLQVQVQADSQILTYSLKDFTGNMNYTSTATGTVSSWSNVTIKNPSLPSNGNIYGTALLTATGS